MLGIKMKEFLYHFLWDNAHKNKENIIKAIKIWFYSRGMLSYIDVDENFLEKIIFEVNEFYASNFKIL